MKVLLDNDIVLDFLLKRKKFFDDADEIFVRLQNLEFDGYIAAITPINAFYTCRKEIGKGSAFEAVGELLGLVEVCPVGKDVLQRAFSLDFSDFEDAVQCASAMAESLDAIVTRNTKDYKNSPMQVHSPSEFLEVLQTESAN
ncbi:MAG: PIN domain-containing protein [Acidobacteriota bacterium]|nr:PIN domain-containing protein [Acidobacteriota bacterium]